MPIRKIEFFPLSRRTQKNYNAYFWRNRLILLMFMNDRYLYWVHYTQTEIKLNEDLVM